MNIPPFQNWKTTRLCIVGGEREEGGGGGGGGVKEGYPLYCTSPFCESEKGAVNVSFQAVQPPPPPSKVQ